MVDAAKPIPGTSRLILGGLMVLAGVLRLGTLSAKSMWVDEGLTALCAESFSYALRQCYGVGVNSPGTIFMTILPYGWWPNEFGLRLVPALFGIASVPALYLLLRSWTNEAGALSAALLLTVSPLHLHHSQDARAYSVMIFCSIVSTWALDRLCDSWQRGWPASKLTAWAGVFALVTLLNLYNHYFAGLVLAVHFTWTFGLLLLPGTRERIRATVCAGVLFLSIVAGFSFWLPPVMRLANQSWVRAGVSRKSAVNDRSQIPDQVALKLRRQRIVKETLERLLTHWTQGVVSPSGYLGVIWTLHLMLAVMGGVVLLRQDRRTAALAGLLLGAALSYVVIAAAPLLLFGKVYVYVRHVVFAYPIFLALQATALGWIWSKNRAVFGLICGLTILCLMPALRTYHNTNRQDWRQACDFLDAQLRSGDQVIVDCADWAFLAYFQRKGYSFGQLRNPAILTKGPVEVILLYPATTIDKNRKLWYVHAESSPKDAKYQKPNALRLATPSGLMGGTLEIYEHPPHTIK
jgi:hypothetical protein